MAAETLPELDPWLPAGPLLAYTEKLRAAHQDVETQVWDERAGEFRLRQSGWFEGLTGVQIQHSPWNDRLQRARRSGRIRAVYVDEFCTALLGWHPSALYGLDWFGIDEGAA